jgi:lipoprotein signal peptidase
VADLSRSAKNEMTTYYFLFALLVMTVNFGYAFSQLGEGKEQYFSIPLFLASVLVSLTCLVWIRKRLAAAQKKKEAIQQPQQQRP